MAPKENPDVLELLRASAAEIRAAADGLSDVQAKQKPAPEKWSVLDCVEHLVITEGRMQGRLENPESAGVPPADRAKESQILTGAANRTNRIQAPEPSRPTGQFPTLGEALKEFDAARGKTIALAERHGPGLYALAIVHPVFGRLNGTELMVLVAAHSRRHAEQMREVRAVVS